MHRMSPAFKKTIFSFRAKVAAAAVLSLFFTMALSDFFIYRFTLNNQLELLRQQLISIAQTGSLQIDADMLLRVPLDRKGIDSPEYRTIASRLEKIRKLNSTIKYIYTFRKSKDPAVLRFIVDLDPELKVRKQNSVTAYPGDPYLASRFPEMLRAFDGASADKKIMEDEWGTTLSGYAPLRNRLGVAVAILGIDMDATEVYRAQRQVNRAALIVFLLGVLLSILLGILLSRQVTARIQKLIEGARKVSDGDLSYRVEVSGHDEIRELSEEFNAMTDSLSQSRKELEDYFYRVVQSFIGILEAKDKYTQGHSQRVGEYAQRIALRMGLSAEQASLLRKAGELHDIGKLAVHDHILNKPGALTDEEWMIIRQHPVIGAEALKPLSFSDIISLGIRHHHERHDGGGYPDKMSGDNISIYAQIISVADAYDAMTTTRSYRKAMDRKAALAELHRHSGTQFHPAVVEAFFLVIEGQQHQAP